MLFSGGVAGLAIYLATQFDSHDGGFQFEQINSWIPDLGIAWHVGVDGISLWLVVLTGRDLPARTAGIDPHGDPKPYTAWMLVLQAGSMGAFLALDVFMFFVFFEIVLVPMYMLISGWGYSERKYAATKFFLYTMLGSALMLVAILASFRSVLLRAASRSIFRRSPKVRNSPPTRPGGCSLPSRLRSRSRCRWCRSIRGYPMRTHRRPPVVPSFSPLSC